MQEEAFKMQVGGRNGLGQVWLQADFRKVF